MNKNFDKYLDPPDDLPVCEDGCGEALVKDIDGEWSCPNKYCPLKFDGTARELAETRILANDMIGYLRRKNARNNDRMTALEAAALPFAHPDLCRVLAGNVEGDASIIYARGDAIITLGDCRKLAALLGVSKQE